MGWNSANRIFDPVAKALVNTGAADDVTRKVLSDLISELRDGDWDTCDESLEDFLGQPAVIAAFHDHNIHTQDRRCCLVGGDARNAIQAMRGDEFTEDEMTTALNAFAHQLAEKIRETELPQDYVDMFDNGTRWAADLIDPQKP